MKIKKNDLKRLIENYLIESYPANKTEGDQFRAWVNDNYPKYAKEKKLSRSGTVNDYVKNAWEIYGKEYESSIKKQENMQGCVILCNWKGSKPVTDGWTEGISKKVFDTVFPQGHGGIILIRPNGLADYFDFGRYKDKQWNHCSAGEYEALRGVSEKFFQDTPLKTAIGIPGVIRHKHLGKANIKEYKPSLLSDPIKSVKKHLMSYGMITVDQEEAKSLITKAKNLGSLKDGDCYICPDVGYVNDAYNYAMEQMKKCHLYSLVPVTNNYNCGTFASHLAMIAGKGSGMRADFWQSIKTLLDPTTQPAGLIPHLAENYMDAEFMVHVP